MDYELPETEGNISNLRAGLRALGRSLVTGEPPWAHGERGSLRAFRGFFPGTKPAQAPAAEAEEGGDREALGIPERAGIQFTLTVVDAPPANGLPIAAKSRARTIFSFEIPFRAFRLQEAARGIALDAIGRRLPRKGFWGLVACGSAVATIPRHSRAWL